MTSCVVCVCARLCILQFSVWVNSEESEIHMTLRWHIFSLNSLHPFSLFPTRFSVLFSVVCGWLVVDGYNVYFKHAVHSSLETHTHMHYI